MKTEWDYTILADAYLKRPDYADAAVDAMLSLAGVEKGDRFCDVGAGVAHLTMMLADRGLEVIAVEPNDAMRNNGIKRTVNLANVAWYEGTGEATGQPAEAFDMVTFGSSFNVCDRQQALKETARILKPRGWFACMWNHRHLDDPIQARIEAIIKERVPGYGYGTRREDQTAVIDESGLFGPVVHLDARVTHQQTFEECLEAWRSHATLERQAGAKFDEVISAIDDYLKNIGTTSIKIPYSTNIWVAQLK
ncbi:methyltransferase [Pseudomonas sp. SG-MS2]|uniref:class I SAM-dependent methyltransferase n=1 Tax=Pseudomonas sp. SG-MS2 TaxID=1914534 RepID=UPI00137AFBFB|nr:methyltransferase domain-containing protein [Pseudomonas sp. SG-MS2]KAF1311248.1 methyltransferase [Pseudomonas sp. SG-MS2]